MLQNVPQIEEQVFKDWVQNRFGEKPVLINWSYNVDELELAHREKENAVIELNKIKITLRKCAEREAVNPNSILNDIKKD